MNLFSSHVRDSVLSCFDGSVATSVKKRNENEILVYCIPPSPKCLYQDGALMDVCSSSAIEAFQ